MIVRSKFFVFFLLLFNIDLSYATPKECYDIVKNATLSSLGNLKSEILQHNLQEQKKIIMDEFKTKFYESIKQCDWFDLVALSEYNEEAEITFTLSKSDGGLIKYPPIVISRYKWIENNPIHYGFLMTSDNLEENTVLSRQSISQVTTNLNESCSDVSGFSGSISDNAELNTILRQLTKENGEFYVQVANNGSYTLLKSMIIYNPDGWAGRGTAGDWIYYVNSAESAEDLAVKLKTELSNTPEKSCKYQNIYVVILNNYKQCETTTISRGDVPGSGGTKKMIDCISAVKVIKKIGTVI